jgi:hypothetical protein
MKKKFGFWIVEEQLPFVFPLFGLAVLWFASGWAQIVDMLQEPAYYYTGKAVAAHEYVHGSVYIFFVGIAVLGAMSVASRRIARRLPESRIAKSAMGFSTLSTITTLIIGVVYGFVTFIAGYGSGDPSLQHNELVRIFSVYVPIILDAGLLVAVILLSFVSHNDGEENA